MVVVVSGSNTLVHGGANAHDDITVVRVAQWIRRPPTEREIPGSSPGMDNEFLPRIPLGSLFFGREPRHGY